MISRIAVIVALVLSGCQIPSEERFSQLRPGMSGSEVVALLGEPSSRHAAAPGRGGNIDVPAFWQYGDNVSTFASGAMFQNQPASDRVWAIYFDAAGNVSRWQKPSWQE